MITAIHSTHITVVHITVMHVAMLAETRALTITHIAWRSLQRLRCEQYKNGQKNVFHNTIIHFYASGVGVARTGVGVEGRLLECDLIPVPVSALRLRPL